MDVYQYRDKNMLKKMKMMMMMKMKMKMTNTREWR